MLDEINKIDKVVTELKMESGDCMKKKDTEFSISLKSMEET